MMPTKKLSTSITPKGVKFLEVCAAQYNKAQLSDEPNEEAQRLNMNPEFAKDLFALIKKRSAINQYADQAVSSDYTYPNEYKGPRPITEQVRAIMDVFGLSPVSALEYTKTLPALPEGAEGWFAIPKLSAVAAKYFASITDPAEQYCEAVKLVHQKLYDNGGLHNGQEGNIVPTKLRQHTRTVTFLEQLEAQQEGDILIIAAQYGMRHRGKSVLRARETFVGNEFGLGTFAVGCMTLVHPDRYIRWEELGTDCPGDEFAPVTDGVSFSGVPFFCFDDRRSFDARVVSHADAFFGSVSGFVPQE